MDDLDKMYKGIMESRMDYAHKKDILDVIDHLRKSRDLREKIETKHGLQPADEQSSDKEEGHD